MTHVKETQILEFGERILFIFQRQNFLLDFCVKTDYLFLSYRVIFSKGTREIFYDSDEVEIRVFVTELS